MIKHKRWMAMIVLVPILFLFITLGAAQIQSVLNYLKVKDVVDSGGSTSQSTNYVLTDAIGQPGGLGAAASSNYRESSGFFAAPGVPPSLVRIYPETETDQSIGSELWVDIMVGSADTPVENLFGISFELNYAHTDFVDIVTPYSDNVISGDFIGDDVVFIQTVTEDEGKVNIGISRKAGQGGVNGYGTVTRIKFTSRAETPEGTSAQFSLSSVAANDPAGNNIPLAPGSITVTFSAGIIVWPGDTNNDGLVNQADILPLGLYWGSTGPARSGASISWTGQAASPWTPENATYADANGDGTVNQADVLPIGLNWNQTHGLNKTLSANSDSINLKSLDNPVLKINVIGDLSAGSVCYAEIWTENVTNLFGIAFEMVYTPTTYIDSVKVEADSWLGDDIISYNVVDEAAGKISFGLSRKSGQGGIAGSGIIAKVRLRLKNIDAVETTLSLQNIAANDDVGNPIQFDVESFVITSVVNRPQEIKPDDFELFQNHPNPFNPETTISFAVKQPCRVILRVYNVVGQQIAQLIDDNYQPGVYRVNFKANELPSGVYFYQIQMGSFVAVNKMLLLE